MLTPLRKKRLLILAKNGKNCKPWYGQYRELAREGLVKWGIGHAWITPKGDEYLTSCSSTVRATDS